MIDIKSIEILLQQTEERQKTYLLLAKESNEIGYTFVQNIETGQVFLCILSSSGVLLFESVSAKDEYARRELDMITFSVSDLEYMNDVESNTDLIWTWNDRGAKKNYMWRHSFVTLEQLLEHYTPSHVSMFKDTIHHLYALGPEAHIFLRDQNTILYTHHARNESIVVLPPDISAQEIHSQFSQKQIELELAVQLSDGDLMGYVQMPFEVTGYSGIFEYDGGTHSVHTAPDSSYDIILNTMVADEVSFASVRISLKKCS